MFDPLDDSHDQYMNLLYSVFKLNQKMAADFVTYMNDSKNREDDHTLDDDNVVVDLDETQYKEVE